MCDRNQCGSVTDSVPHSVPDSVPANAPEHVPEDVPEHVPEAGSDRCDRNVFLFRAGIVCPIMVSDSFVGLLFFEKRRSQVFGRRTSVRPAGPRGDRAGRPRGETARGTA